MSLRRTLPAGVIDAGLNSLATFAVGLAANDLFETAFLGVYTVFFTAHLMGVAAPMHLIYLPAEVKAIQREMKSRLTVLRRSMWLASGPSLLTGIAMLLALVVVWNQATVSQLISLAWTAAVATVLVPAQAHLRRMLHIGGLSWRAAVVSATQLVATVTAIFALLAAGAPDATVPFGALSLATGTSILVALFLAAPWRQASPDHLKMADLFVSGRWLLVTGLVPAAAGFVAAALVSHLASVDDLGYAYAARLAAQPLFVLGVGLNAVLGPRSMEAAHRSDKRSALRIQRIFAAVIVVATAGYLAVAGGAWIWNPFIYISGTIPKAYDIAFLVALMIVANAVVSVALPGQREMLGGRLEKKLVTVEILSSAALVVAAATAGVTASYAWPASVLVQGVWRNIHYRKALEPLYEEPPKTFFGHAFILPP
jgi:hypothetical protein